MRKETAAKIIVVTGTAFILSLKFFIRPQFAGMHNLSTYIMGIFPNLLGSFLLPVGLIMLPKFFSHVNCMKSFYWFGACCFLALCFNEALQLIPIFGRTFDLNDIAASLVGLLTGIQFVQLFFLSPAVELAIESE